MNQPQTQPKLAPPGAGIPWIARVVLRLIVNPLKAGKEPQQAMRDRFLRNHEKALEVFRSIPQSDRETKVLVPRQRGLEDSSRYWSAAMVLEHLEIVGTAIGEVIVELSKGHVPQMEVSTAAVKPKGQDTWEQREKNFEKFFRELVPSIDSRLGDFENPAVLAHPWFGPFTARKWYWLLGIHGGIHLQQMRAIRHSLRER